MPENYIFDLENYLQVFYELGLDVEFKTTTKTAINKGIIETNGKIRDFLKRNNLHDYSKQGNGDDHKILLQTYFLTENGLIVTESGLYRAKTRGDPRIRISNIKNYVNPWDSLALVTNRKTIYYLNISQEDISSSLLSGGKVYKHLKKLSENEEVISKELLSKTYKEKVLNWISELSPVEEDFEYVNELSPEEFIEKFDSKYQNKPEYEKKVVSAINRPSALSNKIKELYGHKCRICGYHGFEKKNGDRYAEVHHMIELNKQAPKTLQSWNVIVVCPTCHRKLHYGKVESEFLDPGWKINIDGDEVILSG